MIKSYKLKIYANKNKIKKLNDLLSFWTTEVNKKINIFWKFESLTGSYCPKEYALGGRLVRDASNKAWTLCKTAKKSEQKEQSIFTGNEIDLNKDSFKFLDLKTKEFDFWVKVTHLEKRHRLALPCKRTGIFNGALERGKLRNSAKIIKYKNNYYLQLYVEFPEQKQTNTKKLGIDVGLNNTVATSDGSFYGSELKELRIRTKWRNYTGLSAFKQALNTVAKELVVLYPETDFVAEDLNFKGKRKRSKTFRRRNNNWAYKHLARKLESIGQLEGFNVIYVDPAYSSQTCPKCLSINVLNRVGERFCCIQCGYNNHADTVGAINLLERVNWERCVPTKGV